VDLGALWEDLSEPPILLYGQIVEVSQIVGLGLVVGKNQHQAVIEALRFNYIIQA